MVSADNEEGIGLLGGSFDPVHNGHLSIAKSFLRSDYLKELWILLTPAPPHKTDQSLTDYEQRIKMLNTAFKRINNVRVTDVERELPKPSYTIQTLRHLHDKFPKEKFYLCIGEDSLRDFKEWKEWKLILQYCDLLVAKRPNGKVIELDPEIEENTHFIPHQPIEVSSTSIRRAVADGKDVSDMVPADVYQLIKQYNLYKNY